MVININTKNFEALKKLLKDEYILKKEISSQKLINSLVECNAIEIDGKPQCIYLRDINTLFAVIKSNGYNINCIEDIDYFTEESEVSKSRDEVAEKFSDTKRIESKSFNGLMISIFEKIEVTLNGEKQYIYPISGTGLFIHYSTKLELDNDTVLVGVENPQVVWFINKYQHLFNKDKQYVFLSLSEFKTSYQYKWLESFKGEYIHFGDFDLAGINIYLNSILPRLKNCMSHSFLIPNHIYKIMKKKNYKKDYSSQTRYLNIDTKDDEKLKELIEFIKNRKITLEQEYLSKLPS
ncbi:DUF2220 family protein [Arcobacter sp. KX21116]|uniref:DUF7281 domain-containing protein n=1 Tax=Arcobacter iocasae TaxID=2906515 RepID=UPI0035D40CAF